MPSLPPGFVDLQVNGYGGVDFSSPTLTLDDVFTAANALAEHGTLAFCPTVITAAPEVYRRVLPVLSVAIRAPEARGRLLGIHLEGPFLSPEDGAVGAHPREWIRPPSQRDFDDLYRAADGQVALLTVAPEQPGALELIRHAVSLGVAVSIGHTLASGDTIRAAVDAGASLSTHLGNGVPNLIHRHNNPIWAQLAHPDLTAMLITDGHHLPPDVIRAFLAAKGARRAIVTSDAAPPAGLPPGIYSIFGTTAELEPSGRLRNRERETLAGSAATLLDCMNFLASLGVLTEAELWQVARDNPLAALRLSPDRLPDEQFPVTYRQGIFHV